MVGRNTDDRDGSIYFPWASRRVQVLPPIQQVVRTDEIVPLVPGVPGEVVDVGDAEEGLLPDCSLCDAGQHCITHYPSTDNSV